MNNDNQICREQRVKDMTTTVEIVPDLTESSEECSNEKLRSSFEFLEEPPIEDSKDITLTNGGGDLSDRSNEDKGPSSISAKADIDHDLPITSGKTHSIEHPLNRGGNLTDQLADSSIISDASFDVNHLINPIARTTAAVATSATDKNVVVNRGSKELGPMLGLGLDQFPSPKNFRASIQNLFEHLNKGNVNSCDIEQKREEDIKLQTRELELNLRFSHDDFDEDYESVARHNSPDEESVDVEGGFEVMMEFGDETSDHSDEYPQMFSSDIEEEIIFEYDTSTDPFATREGNTFSWRNMSMTENKTGRKILDHCWGQVPKHQLTAVMGASGAGKSTVLNILSGRQQSTRHITVEAEISLDNHRIDPAKIAIRRSIAFVAQDDSLLATSTPREAIRFSAKMRLPRTVTSKELDELTACMLDELGLMHCADSLVGGPLIKGISGGERKRTSVGVELVTMPSIVCLDEPTSGLDAFSALQCCQVLRKVADAGSSVLLTIHQPSSEIFEIFNHVILMNGGRVMYQGSVEEISTFFGSRGHPIPRNYNPADWCIDVAQGVPIAELIEAGYFPDGSHITPGGRKSMRTVSEHDSISLIEEVFSLFEREVLNVKRDWAALVGRMGIQGTLSFFIGLIFFDVGNADKLDPFSLQSQFGAMMVILITCMMSTVQVVMFVYPEQRPIFLREYSTNHYSVLSYLMAHLTVESILIAMNMFIVVTIIYFMVGLSGNYFIYMLLTFTLSSSVTAQATCLACLAGDNIKLATQLMPLIFQPQLLFAGFFLSPDLMPQWLSHIQLACTMTYATRVMVVEEFYACSSDPRENKACQEILDNTRSDPNEVWWYWLVLACTVVFFRLLAIFLLRQSAKKFY